MKMEEQFIIEVWDLFKEYITPKNLDTAANHFVDFIVDNDVDEDTLNSLIGMDATLDDAIKAMLRELQGTDDADELNFDDEDY